MSHLLTAGITDCAQDLRANDNWRACCWNADPFFNRESACIYTSLFDDLATEPADSLIAMRRCRSARRFLPPFADVDWHFTWGGDCFSIHSSSTKTTLTISVIKPIFLDPCTLKARSLVKDWRLHQNGPNTHSYPLMMIIMIAIYYYLYPRPHSLQLQHNGQ